VQAPEYKKIFAQAYVGPMQNLDVVPQNWEQQLLRNMTLALIPDNIMSNFAHISEKKILHCREKLIVNISTAHICTFRCAKTR